MYKPIESENMHTGPFSKQGQTALGKLSNYSLTLCFKGWGIFFQTIHKFILKAHRKKII